MDEAEASDNRYADLHDPLFREKYGIGDVEDIHTDDYDVLKEEYITMCRNPETGEHELMKEKL